MMRLAYRLAPTRVRNATESRASTIASLSEGAAVPPGCVWKKIGSQRLSEADRNAGIQPGEEICSSRSSRTSYVESGTQMTLLIVNTRP